MPKRSRKDVNKDLANLQAAALAALVETGFLMAAADGEVSEEELAVIAGVIQGFTDDTASDEQIDALIKAAANALKRDGWEARLEASKNGLPTQEIRELGLMAAAVVMLSNEEATDEEEEIYFEIADAFEIGKDDADDLLDQAEALLDEDEAAEEEDDAPKKGKGKMGASGKTGG